MRRVVFSLFVVSFSLSLFFLVQLSFSGFLIAETIPHAPHNEDNSISCADCHTDPLPEADSSDICITCHDGVSAPLALTHSNAVIHGGQPPPYAGLSFACLDCHDPHFHNQLVNLPDLFLVTATIDPGSIVDNGNSTSTLSYSSAVIISGWNPPPHADNADWGAKTAAGRGLVLVADKDNPDATYEIVSATATQITVNGVMSTSFEGNTFGIMYSMLINDTVDPDGEGGSAPVAVRFYDRSGANSFADGDGTHDGICEVCHTQTDHFRADGTVNVNPGVNMDHTAATDCTDCHTHEQGFGLSGSGNCGSCHPNWGSHPTHTEADCGPKLACYDCHDTNNYPLLSDGQDLANTTVCDPCHSAGGSYNGVDSSGDSIGARDNWITGVYDGGMDIQAGKERWCAGCHDNFPSVIQGISAPNVAGDDADYGYYQTGHGKHGSEQAIGCLECHDASMLHTDGAARTYAAAADNYQAGYRLKDIDGQAPMDVPRSGEAASSQFRLCFNCHDNAPFLVKSNTNTNFRSDVDDTCTPLDPVVDNVNKHNFHLASGVVNVWDSDWDGETGDSKMSCPACHNVHGAKPKTGASNAPAMIRTGELIGRPDDALNLDYFINSCSDQTFSTTNETASSTGGMLKWQGMGAGSVAKNGVCTMCHNENEPYWRSPTGGVTGCENCHGHDAGYEYETGKYSQGKGSFQAHSTHTENDSDDLFGPHIDCADCHQTSNFPYFKSGSGGDGAPWDLSETDVCDTCHSPGGTYDGIADPVIGAKSNWESGVYSGPSLQTGKEKWCATCHDEEPSVISGVAAPGVIGDENGTYNYGTGWGFYKTGHGLPAGETYPSKGGIETLSGRPIECDSCHDYSAAHIDGLARTFDCGPEGDRLNCDATEYRTSYRLKLVGTEEPMIIPWATTTPRGVDASYFRLCVQCHVAEPFTDSSNTHTNFYTWRTLDGDANWFNRHVYHLGLWTFTGSWPADYLYAYDVDNKLISGNSRPTCVTCHNVHGSTQLAMIRDGKLIGREPGQLIRYFDENTTAIPAGGWYQWPPNPEDVTLAASIGTFWQGASASNLCGHCHAWPSQFDYRCEPVDIVGDDPDLGVEPDCNSYVPPFQTSEVQTTTLEWTGENGYVSDGVEPDSGYAGDQFTFRVKVTNDYNEVPWTIQLWIDKDDDGSYENNDSDPAADEKIDLDELDPYDSHYTDGKLFTVVLTLDKAGNNSLNYRFHVEGGWGETVELPASPGPDPEVVISNNQPVLSWTGEPYFETDGVHPNVGGLGCNYEFRVTYTDAEGECPSSIQVWIDFDDDGYEVGGSDKLTLNAGAGECSTGKLYYSDPVTFSAGGDYTYRFYASDGTDEATTEAGPVSDNTVTVQATVNSPPQLDWVTESCLTDGVKPVLGLATGDFEFKVMYTDLEGTAPSSIKVWVDLNDDDFVDTGEEQTLTWVNDGDENYMDGEVFTYTLTIDEVDAGEHEFIFSASDGTDAAVGEPTETDSNRTVTIVSTANAIGVRQGLAGYSDPWYETIQAAIDPSGSTDPDARTTILVYEGTYNENVVLDRALGLPDIVRDNNITLQSVCGPELTVIQGRDHDGDDEPDAITVHFNEITSPVIDGFTITNGTEGIVLFHSSITVKNCIIEGNGRGIRSSNDIGLLTMEDTTIQNNVGTGHGAGIYLYGGSAQHTLSGSVIKNNQTSEFGGGIFLINSGTGKGLAIEDTTISNNTASGSGGGIYITRSLLDLEKVTLSSNTAGAGGGLFMKENSTVNMTNSNVVDNSADNAGGGIHIWCPNDPGYLNMTNCTVSNNSLVDPETGYGGGLYKTGGWPATVSINNTIFWGNAAGSGHEIFISLGTTSITWSNVLNNSNALSAINGGVITIDENCIDVDPLLVDRDSGDYHLKQISPAIDLATSTDAPSDDIDGDTRPAGSGYDMGADEYVPMP